MAYPTTLPGLTQFETNMELFGARYVDRLTSGYYTTNDAALAEIYYDASWVFDQIYDYTGNVDSSWRTGADAADQVYINYLVPASYRAQGYRTFGKGFLHTYLRNGSLTAKNALIQLSQNGAFTTDNTALSASAIANSTDGGSREAAYALETYLDAELVGEAVRTKRDGYVDQVINHLEQWTLIQSADYVRPFMAALSSRALIQVWQQLPTHSRRDDIITQLIQTWTWIWNNCWLAADKAFKYTDRDVPSGGQEAAPDLNLIIVPVFGFLYHVTGDTSWIDKGDLVFDGGVMRFDYATEANPYGFWVSGGYLYSGKQFNQNYCWALRYVEWREAEPLTVSGGGDGGEDDGGGDTDPGGADGGSGGTGSTGGTVGGNNTISTLVTTPQPSLYLPVEPKGFLAKFQDNGWTTIQDKVNNGYNYWIHPGALTALFEQTVDLGTEITTSTLVSLVYNPVTIAGSVSITPTISLSADNDTYTDHSGTSVYASSFRYVRVKLEATATDKTGIVRLDEIRLTLSLKELRDAGSGTITVAADGAEVTFNKTFIDIDSVTVSAAYQSGLGTDQPKAIYDFTDAPNPTGMTVYLYNSTGKVTGGFSWAVKGV